MLALGVSDEIDDLLRPSHRIKGLGHSGLVSGVPLGDLARRFSGAAGLGGLGEVGHGGGDAGGLVRHAGQARAISTPARVATMVRSLVSPRWPIRNTLPATLAKPVPSDTSNWSSATLRKASALWPSGISTAVRMESSTSLPAQDFQAPGPDRAAHGLGMPVVAGEHALEALLVQHVDGLGQAVEQVGGRRVGEEPILVGGQHLLPAEIGLGQLADLAAARALSLMALKPSPGGSISPFCEPPTVTSTPHSSWR